ncbi:MAG: winged helix-turn-helix transcriptional regulator [Rhodospirillaceae bacterium]|nr:winged helix-turn-helix transcriptional regulator [Rhodospirillaceae bacterium]
MATARGRGGKKPVATTVASAQAAAPKARTKAEEKYFVESFIPYLLNHVVDRYNKLFKQGLKAMGLSIPQWRVIAVLNAFEGLSFTEIQALTVIDQPTLSRTVDQMAKRGIVLRKSRPDDGRYAVVSLTPRGKEIYDSVWPVAWNAFAFGVRGFSPAEQEQLAEALKRMLTNLRELPFAR